MHKKSSKHLQLYKKALPLHRNQERLWRNW